MSDDERFAEANDGFDAEQSFSGPESADGYVELPDLLDLAKAEERQQDFFSVIREMMSPGRGPMDLLTRTRTTPEELLSDLRVLMNDELLREGDYATERFLHRKWAGAISYDGEGRKETVMMRVGVYWERERDQESWLQRARRRLRRRQQQEEPTS